MTKGQEIAGNAAETHIKKTLYVSDLADAIDAAIAEAVSKRTVECAEDVCTELCAFDETGLADRCYNLCLALNAPPAPAYPFQKPCQCWTYHPSGNFYLTTRSQFYLNRDANYCEVCGAQRVKVD